MIGYLSSDGFVPTCRIQIRHALAKEEPNSNGSGPPPNRADCRLTDQQKSLMRLVMTVG